MYSSDGLGPMGEKVLSVAASLLGDLVK